MIALLAIVLAQAASPAILTLEEAERVARERQPQLRAARGTAEAAQGRVEQSRSGLLPQLSASADYQRTTTNFLFRPGGTQRPDQQTSWSSINFFESAATLSQLLWDFGQTSNRLRSSEAGARAAADEEVATRLQVMVDVRIAFFSAVAARDLVEVARETLANQRIHLVQIQGFVEEGTRPPIDLSQARADFANAQVQLVNTGNAYQRSKVLLNQAMGFEGPTSYQVESETLLPQSGEDGALEPLLEIALANRPEIASASEQVKAQQLLIQSAQGAYGPAIALGGSIVQTTATGSNYIGWNAVGGVTITWNLFQGGLTKGTVHEAEGNLRFALAQLDLLRQQVRVDVEQALLAIRAAKAALLSSKDALVASRQRLSLAEGRYQNGSGSVIEQGDAQIAAANAAAQMVQTEFQLASARAQFIRALGEG
jgi:outer membrane protein